jgi:putative salt-induced outer membrane protein
MRPLLGILALILAPVALLSQEPAPAPHPVQLTLDLGFVDASGNSNVTSFNLGEKLSWKLDRLTLGQSVKALYGEAEGKTTAEAYDAGVRADYPLGKTLSLFALGTFQRNPFAGIAERWAAGPGIGIGLVRTARDTLSLEGTFMAQRERSIANVRQSFGATRTAAAFKHLFATSTAFTQTLEWIANLETMDDQRVLSETALTAPLSKQIALRVAYLIRFDNLPEPGFVTTDRLLTTGAQISF